jgi:hypothetical protein
MAGEVSAVCTKNVVRVDLVTESHNVGGNSHAAVLPFEAAGFTVQVDSLA